MRIVVMTALFLSLAVTVAASDCWAPLGSTGRPLPLFMPMRKYIENMLDDMIDSGCSLVYCNGGCDLWDTGWKCHARGTYERYGYDEEGRHPLPISVSVEVTCDVVDTSGFGWPCHIQWSCSGSNTGSGRVSATTECWRYGCLNGYELYWGECACTEL